MEIMIQSTLDFLRGDALGEEIKSVDIATILETVCDRLVDSGHDVALRRETYTPLPCRLTNKSGGGLSVTITLPQATSLPGVSNRM
jgi:hypothetical protein